MINAKKMIESGLKQGPWVPDAVAFANEHGIESALDKFNPKTIPMQEDVKWHVNLSAENEHEEDNLNKVTKTMNAVMKTPGVVSGAVMPDACPAGGVGIIPVGGVVASKYIHPSMHSADICCSVMLSTYPDKNPDELLDLVHKRTHFGPGGRKGDDRFEISTSLLESFKNNDFLKDMLSEAIQHMGTQGDGNHFSYIGTRESDGVTCLVTHHGSRKPGAVLYKKGIKAAKEHCRDICPGVKNPWLDIDTDIGAEYWEALQIIRQWTKQNHENIHNPLLVEENYWNEHNFVFKKDDGLFYHAKGATPAFDGWANDATELSLIPLNMAEPILITKGLNADNGLGFAPHGAGRNYSRTQHRKLSQGTDHEIFERETKGLDVRFYSGEIDISELPSAYKSADTVQRQMNDYGLADVVDRVMPYGCIMAGDWKKNSPWQRKNGNRTK